MPAYLTTVLSYLGAAVDAAVPFAVGNRTKIAAVVAVVAPVAVKVAMAVLPIACSAYPPIAGVCILLPAALSVAGTVSAAAVPAFAAAGLVRSTPAAK